MMAICPALADVGDETHRVSAENPESYQRVSDNNWPTDVGDIVGEPAYHQMRLICIIEEWNSEARGQRQ